MVVVHEAAEVEHVGVVALGVQTVQHGNEAAPKGWEYNIRVPAHLYKVASQPGQVFDEDQIDNAFPGVLQHLQKTGTLKIAAAVTVVGVSFHLRPSVQHHKFGEDFPLIFNTGGFVGGDVAFRFRGVGSVIHAQAAVDADLIQLFHNAPSFPASAPRPHSRRNGNAP